MALLLGGMIFFTGLGLVSYADAMEIQGTSVEFKQMEPDGTIEQAQTISQALDKYRLSLAEARQAKSGVMTVYWKIEAADSMMQAVEFAKLQDPQLIDDLKMLAVPKNISALVNGETRVVRTIELEQTLASLQDKARESDVYAQRSLAAK